MKNLLLFLFIVTGVSCKKYSENVCVTCIGLVHTIDEAVRMNYDPREEGQKFCDDVSKKRLQDACNDMLNKHFDRFMKEVENPIHDTSRKICFKVDICIRVPKKLPDFPLDHF
ncbi:hypothetical protein RB195_005686 [Necator americanus]|uniref:Saposin B-type domain-containing protein n=1 Tax=Necator americanus TaxID=51031 RepID=A0ABR1BP28_NECAM